MQQKHKNILLLVTLAVLAFFFLAGGSVSAQDYVPLSPLPGATQVDTSDPSGYFANIFGIVIGIAGVLAVIVMMIYGVMYMLSASEGKKAAAKAGLTSVVFGLFIIFLSYVTLLVINPDLVSLRFFERFKSEFNGGGGSTSTTKNYCYPSSSGQTNVSYTDLASCEQARQAEIDAKKKELENVKDLLGLQKGNVCNDGTRLQSPCLQNNQVCYFTSCTSLDLQNDCTEHAFVNKDVCQSAWETKITILENDVNRLETTISNLEQSSCQQSSSCP